MSGTIAPPEALTAENLGPAVIVITYTLVVASILFTASRLIANYTLGRQYGADDVAVVVGSALGLVQSILTERAADAGLGKQMSKVDDANIDRYFKFIYASQIVAIFSMTFAKTSVSLLIIRLSPVESSLARVCLAIIGGIAFWTVFSVFALAFQCQFPRPWVYTPDRCVGRGALWYPVIVLNILLDFILSIVFVPILRKLQMRWMRKLLVAVLFGLRVLVCLAATAQLVIIGSVLHSFNQTRAAVKLVIVNQIVMNLSIVMANMPSLSRFFSELQSGPLMRIPDSRYGIELSGVSGSSENRRLAPKHNSQISAQPRQKVQRDTPKFRPDNGVQVKSHIFADNAASKKVHMKRTKREKDELPEDELEIKMAIADTGVWQTLEFTQEVESASSSKSSH